MGYRPILSYLEHSENLRFLAANRRSPVGQVFDLSFFGSRGAAFDAALWTRSKKVRPRRPPGTY
jgi:hypothetical protein